MLGDELSYFEKQNGWFLTMQLPADSKLLMITCRIPCDCSMAGNFLLTQPGLAGHNYIMRAAITPENKIIIIDALGKIAIRYENQQTKSEAFNGFITKDFSPFLREWYPTNGSPACIISEPIAINFQHLIYNHPNTRSHDIDCKAYAITHSEFDALTEEFDKVNEFYTTLDKSGYAGHLQYYRRNKNDASKIELIPSRDYSTIAKRYLNVTAYKINKVKQYLKEQPEKILGKNKHRELLQEKIIIDYVNLCNVGDLKKTLKCCLYLLEMNIQYNNNRNIALFLTKKKEGIAGNGVEFVAISKKSLYGSVKQHLDAVVNLYKTQFPLFASTEHFQKFSSTIQLLNKILECPQTNIYSFITNCSTDPQWQNIAPSLYQLRKKLIGDNILKYILFYPNHDYEKFVYQHNKDSIIMTLGVPEETNNYKTLVNIINSNRENIKPSNTMDLKKETLKLIDDICLDVKTNDEIKKILNNVKNTIKNEKKPFSPKTLYEPHKCFNYMLIDIYDILKKHKEEHWIAEELSQAHTEQQSTVEFMQHYVTQLDTDNKYIFCQHIPSRKISQHNGVMSVNLSDNDCRKWVTSVIDRTLGKRRRDIKSKCYSHLPDTLILNTNLGEIISPFPAVRPVKVDPAWRIGLNHYQHQLALFIYYHLNQLAKSNDNDLIKDRDALLFHLYLPLAENIKKIYEANTLDCMLTLKTLIKNFKKQHDINHTKINRIIQKIEKHYCPLDANIDAYQAKKREFKQTFNSIHYSDALKVISNMLLQHTDKLLTLEPSKAPTLSETIFLATNFLTSPTHDNKTILLDKSKSLRQHHHMAWHILGLNITLYAGATIATVATVTALNFLTLGAATPIIAAATGLLAFAATITTLILQTKRATQAQSRYTHEKNICSIIKQLDVPEEDDYSETEIQALIKQI